MSACRLPIVLALWLLPVGAPASARGADEDRSETLELLLADPCESWSEVPLLQERILQLGPTVLPELFGVWATGGVGAPPEAVVPLDRRQELAVMGALERLPRQVLAAHLERIANGQQNTAERAAALRLLNRIATAGDLRVCFRLAANEEEVVLALLEPFEECLARLLRREPKAARELGVLLAWVPHGLRYSTAKAIAAGADHAALDVLVDCVGRVPRIDALLVVEIGHLVRGGIPPKESHLEAFRDWLDLQDTSAVELAVLLLAEVSDPVAVPELIDLLETDRIDARAHEALRKITGINLPRSIEPWLSWYEAEQTWHRRQAEDLLRRLTDESPRVVAVAIRKLAGHPLFADEIADGMAPVLLHPEPRIVALACSALGEVRARLAVPDLVACLDHEDDEVRTTAWAALRRITGLELPPEPEAWRRSFDPPLERP